MSPWLHARTEHSTPERRKKPREADALYRVTQEASIGQAAEEGTKEEGWRPPLGFGEGVGQRPRLMADLASLAKSQFHGKED